MAEERGVLRRIIWRDVFPGLLIFRCFRLSIALPVLFLATLGALLMPLGPWLLQKDAANQPPTATILAAVPPEVRSSLPLGQNTIRLNWPPFGLVSAYKTFVEPYSELFNRNASFGRMFSSLGIALWYLLIWSFFGGAITRIAVVQLGLNERLSLGQSVRYVVPKIGWYIAAPLFPVLGIGAGALPLILLGWLMHLSLGVLVAGIVWPLVLIVGFVMAVFATELLFGWPLMWPTISAEEASDSFQAFSNSFSFTFQRPLQYLAYAVIAALLGGLGGWFVEAFAQGLNLLVDWGISLALGPTRLDQILSGELDDSWLIWAGGGLIGLFNQLVQLIVRAYYFSFLFCAASAIYLLLRREVDQTDFDEIYMPEDAGRYSLPPLRPGAHGVPEVDEPPPPATTTEATSE